MKGTAGQRRVPVDFLEAARVPVPPEREQERIVAKIDELFSELDAGVASLQRARALLKKYRQAVLKAAVTGELTRDWRERHKGEIRETGADLLQRILKARRAAWEAAELKKLRAKGNRPKDDRWKQKYKEPQPPDTTGLPGCRADGLGRPCGSLLGRRPNSNGYSARKLTYGNGNFPRAEWATVRRACRGLRDKTYQIPLAAKECRRATSYRGAKSR